jgi:hypothetical protein
MAISVAISVFYRIKVPKTEAFSEVPKVFYRGGGGNPRFG